MSLIYRLSLSKSEGKKELNECAKEISETNIININTEGLQVMKYISIKFTPIWTLTLH
jgi:hypothetical protein